MADPEVHEHAAGLTWTEPAGLARAWHALAIDGRVWLVDPVDEPGMVERAQALGDITGVLQLLDRHERDGSAIAQRVGVPLHRLPTSLPGTPFEVFSIIDKPRWREVGLWWNAGRTLVVPEAVGTGPAFAVGDGPAGVHPFLRLFGVGGLRRWAPDLLLSGHGAPLSGPDTTRALREALDRSRSDLPRFLRKLPALARQL